MLKASQMAAVGGFCALVSLQAGPGVAQSGGWVGEPAVVSPECAQPLVTSFTTSDGRQVEANRLEVSAESVRWVQRAFFADGSPIFESEVTLAATAPAETIAAGASAELRIVGRFESRKLVQGAGGSLTYEVTAEGATVEPAGAVRIDAGQAEDERTYQITPTGPVATVRLSIRNSPCAVSWTWRKETPSASSSSGMQTADPVAVAGDTSCVAAGDEPITISRGGPVEVHDGATGAWTPVAGESRLEQCALMRTGDSSRISIESARFGAVRIIMPGDTVVEAPGVDGVIGLRQGSLLVTGEGDAGAEAYRYRLGSIIISGRGGEFILSQDGQRDVQAVLVKDGDLTVEAGGTRSRLGPETVVVVSRGAGIGEVRAMPSDFWQRVMSVKSEAEFAEIVASARDFAVVRGGPAGSEASEGTSDVAKADVPGADGVAADASAEVNRLIVEARKAWDRAAGLTGAPRSDALREALDHLNAVVDRHPGSDHAVTLISGGSVAGISIPGVRSALDAVVDATVADTTEAPPRAAAEPRRLTATVSLLREGIATEAGRFRFGIRYSTMIEPFLASYGMAEPRGSLIVAVTEASPAEAAGIRPGDMIVRFGEQDVEGPSRLAAIVEETPSSISVPVEIIRIGEGPDDLLDLLARKAEAGDADATTALGVLAHTTFDGRQDLEEAARLYRRAAELGDGFAAYQLGLMNLNGEGISVDLREATRRVQQASAAGVKAANFTLGSMYWNGRYWDGSQAIRDYMEAVRLFHAAARDEIPASYAYLGAAYHGGLGVTRDYAEARRWHTKAVAAGDAAGDGATWAMANLGRLYYFGLGVAVDYAEARRLFEQAGERGRADAKRFLATMYRDGKGMVSDRERAETLFREAAGAGDVRAMRLLGGMLFSSTDSSSQREAVEWLGKASDGGDPDADYALALAYLGDKGIARDYERAARHLVQAIERGGETAVNEMKTNAKAWPREVLEAIQVSLRERGLYKGRIDGRFGPGTLRAIDALVASGRAG